MRRSAGYRLALMILAASAGAEATAEAAAPPGLDLGLSSGDRAVFVWQRDRCDDRHNPDAPARAFRMADGRVRLFVADPANRSFVGPTLEGVRPVCASAHRGAEADAPGRYDDRSWIGATYTADGKTVHALLHVEFHGHRRPALCPAGRYMACWMNAIAQGISRDAGSLFSRAPGGAALVAALPYRYDGAVGYHIGYFSPTNIIEKDGALYALILAQRYQAQGYGTCLLRTTRIDDPAAWRAWNGRSFDVRFQDPYGQAIIDPARHVCAPVKGLGGMVTSVARHAASGLFVALIAGPRPDGRRRDVIGVHYATSRDLITWSRTALLAEIPIMQRFPCGASAVYAYPSLLDGESPSRNFETVGDRAWLYLTRFNMTDCRLGRDRDLVRRSVRIAPRP